MHAVPQALQMQVCLDPVDADISDNAAGRDAAGALALWATFTISDRIPVVSN